MESKIEQVFKQLRETVNETKVLYELSEAEMMVLTQLILEVIKYRMSPQLTVKLLKAAAHFLESSHEVTEKYTKEL